MRRSDAAPASPVQGPCTAGDGGWQEAIAEAVLARFGPDRAPRKTAICRYWHRLEEERRDT